MLRRGALTVLLAACTAAGADPTLLSHVPPDSKVFLGANLSRFLASPFAKTVMDQAQSAQPQVQELIKATGLNPLRDMHEFLLASPGGPKPDRGVVLVKGVFDLARITALAGEAGAAFTSYGGVRVLAGKKPTDGWFAFLDGATAAVGDAQSVRGVIDRGGAGGPDAPLRARIDELGNDYDFWFLSAVPVSGLASGAPPAQFGGAMQGDILKAVTQASGGVRFGPDLLVSIETVSRTEKDAAALADVVKFLVGMAQMSAQKDPRGAEATQFLQRLQLSAAGNVTRMSLSIPQAELEKLAAQAQAMVTAQGAASPPGRQPAAQPGGLTIQSSPRDMGTVTVK
ncbi:MAG: hypothetical protein IT159_13890 [Bryobacterales bacterium]|nr:hypothetical protein [Bryobacterales bacterium]